MHLAPQTGIRQGVKLDFTGLSHFDLPNIGLRHIHFDLVRAHVRNGNHRGARIAGRPQGRDDIADVGVFGEHHRIEGGADSTVIHLHFGFASAASLSRSAARWLATPAEALL